MSKRIGYDSKLRSKAQKEGLYLITLAMEAPLTKKAASMQNMGQTVDKDKHIYQAAVSKETADKVLLLMNEIFNEQWDKDNGFNIQGAKTGRSSSNIKAYFSPENGAGDGLTKSVTNYEQYNKDMEDGLPLGEDV